MDGKDHATCFVGEYCIVLGGGIVKKLEAFFHSLFRWACLFRSKSAEGG